LIIYFPDEGSWSIERPVAQIRISSLIGPLIFRHDYAALPCLVHIDDALIAASPKDKRQVLSLQYEWAVYQRIGLI
jgi:hypothetical protein